jgi:DNA polymerase I-like protein with 3'-5' exonuclease and polymerase domains
MLINIDAKQLEWVCAVYLSGDQVGKYEINQGIDIHSDNERTLGLPSRLVAKVFLFRTIYADAERGGAFAFANDPQFAHVSTSERWWQERITKFYDKYKGLAKWHANLLKEVGSTGRWTSPTGRTYNFTRRTLKNGDKVWPKTVIYNYPVQGLGADLMSIVRVSLWKRLRKLSNVLMTCTVHDSILIDAPAVALEPIVKIANSVFEDVPGNFLRLFGSEFDLNLKCEIQYGPTWGDMVVIN